MSETMRPQVVVQTMTNADTQYALALPYGTIYFSLKTRDGTAFRMAFESGKVAASTDPYFTIAAGGAYNSPEKLDWSGNVYVACASAGKVVECVCWTKG